MPKHQKNQNKPQNCNLSQQLSCALNDRLSIERVRERNGWKLLLFFFHRTACCWCYQRNSFLLLPSAFFAVFAFLKKFFSNKNEIAVDARADFSGKVKKKCKSISLGWNDRKDFLMLHRSSWQWWKVRVKVECVCYDWCWDACEHN